MTDDIRNRATALIKTLDDDLMPEPAAMRGVLQDMLAALYLKDLREEAIRVMLDTDVVGFTRSEIEIDDEVPYVN